MMFFLCYDFPVYFGFETFIIIISRDKAPNGVSHPLWQTILYTIIMRNQKDAPEEPDLYKNRCIKKSDIPEERYLEVYFIYLSEI